MSSNATPALEKRSFLKPISPYDPEIGGDGVLCRRWISAFVKRPPHSAA
jgi:hypothetical protein